MSKNQEGLELAYARDVLREIYEQAQQEKASQEAERWGRLVGLHTMEVSNA